MINKILSGLIVVAIIVLGVFLVVHKSNVPTTPKVTASLSSLNTGPAPWQPEYQHLPNRLKAAGLSLLTAEGTATHIHSHLDIYIHSQHITVPADIGIPPTGGITPVHTHDTTGIIHIESPQVSATYTLRQFFDIWGVKFTDTSIGSYLNDGTNNLVVYDNGTIVKDPVNLHLSKHHEIVVTYGTTQETPTIPSSYSFPSGL